MTASIPIASYGNNSEVAQAVRASLLPDYDVVHITLTLQAALSELPALVAGDTSAPPSSGLGSNAAAPEAERRVPRAVIFGGGLPEEEIRQVSEAVLGEGGKNKMKEGEGEADGGVRIVVVRREDVLAKGVEGPNAEVIGEILREKLAGL
ncbi:uncharacterized protein E0L32_011809 [Thyridium curvatum]|uniref:Uncharacterized protein n=1 Tax=Thyridium curvatum TaxID=1093900 RepID=A0A507BM93_9PEZI|nr:uncharacterized protein E0L32_011809 [Thyridium curvatum]TPX18311.1 hypothetical protein E0L32_011809 [Thyridium curvatum]